ncbi:MAG TPA: type VI secretion system-associated protein TagF [Gammaproteobacteria bacterium]|nr:type VI secretion system-associated protein TagF [Gammaproteobacteria bacterium]
MPGFFGKIPSHGDFVTRELSRAFIDVWDVWLQGGIAESKTQLGGGWLDVYLTSPIWRFGLVSGICGASAWAGILMPSVDRVGRYFPLTIAAELPPNVNPLQLPGPSRGWFEAIEAVALRALDDDRFDANQLQAAIAAVGAIAPAAAPAGPAAQWGQAWSVALLGGPDDGVAAALAHELVSRHAPRYSVWWTAASDSGAAAVVAAAELPEAHCFADLLRGVPSAAAEPPAPLAKAAGGGAPS